MQLQNLDHHTRRGATERALKLWVDRGVITSAVPTEPGPRPEYRVTIGLDVYDHLTLIAAEKLVEGIAIGARAALKAVNAEAHFVWGQS